LIENLHPGETVYGVDVPPVVIRKLVFYSDPPSV